MWIKNASYLMFAILSFSVSVSAQTTVPQFVPYLSSGLSSPIGIGHAGDNSNRIFIIQQGGQIRVIQDNALLTEPFLNLTNTSTCRYPGDTTASTVGFTSGGERGLLGLAFHPQFGGTGSGRGKVFVSFTDQNGDSMIVRYTLSDPSSSVMPTEDLGSCVVVLRVDQNFSNHNGGHIAFDSNGYLFFGLGDGGSGGDPCNRAQILNPTELPTFDGADASCPPSSAFTSNGGDPNSRALLGKMLRLDVNNTTAAPQTGSLCGRPRADQPTEYAIPTGQPSTEGGAIASACDEVWSYGLRNPWRWSFDRSNGDLLIADVGQGSIEEVNYEPINTSGRNYGWRCREGGSDFNTSNCASPVVAFTQPVITYSHTGGRCSITGGYVYRGSISSLRGQYFYGDYCSGEVWASNNTGTSWSTPTSVFQTLGGTIASFGEDEAGSLYVTRGSQIWILRSEVIFTNGFE
jgi:glucose/arabinose dehydrogenase